VTKAHGSGRATGTILEVPYITGYEPIKGASGKVIGICYVGYKK
jgi:hypothetical protein